MPATYTPTETPARDRRRELDDGGNGRRPPTDKRTGGGGDGDNWNDRKRGRGGPRERLIRYRMGLFFALSAVLMFFVAIVSVFFVAQSSYHFDANARQINEWLPTVIPPLLWLNTAVLLLSSLAIEIARRHMFREVDVMEEWLGLGKPSTRSAVPWLIVTIVLGVAFLAGQVVAWRQLAEQHVYFSNGSPSSHSFYLMTGIHAAHLLLGVLGLLAALTGLYVSRQLENRQILVDCAAWYWHSMGALWVVLFGLLVLCQ
jgi:cytochrome c oxidase subunit 3